MKFSTLFKTAILSLAIPTLSHAGVTINGTYTKMEGNMGGLTSGAYINVHIENSNGFKYIDIAGDDSSGGTRFFCTTDEYEPEFDEIEKYALSLDQSSYVFVSADSAGGTCTELSILKDSQYIE